jgi:hypothetical protein
MSIAFWDDGGGWAWATFTTGGKQRHQDWAADKPALLFVLARHVGLDRRRTAQESEHSPEP